MKKASDLTNKNFRSVKNHFLPSAVTAAVAVAVAVPLTAAFSSNVVGAASAQEPTTVACGTVPAAVAGVASSANPASSTSTGNNSNNSGNNSGNTGGNGGGTGSTNTNSQNTGSTTGIGGLVGVGLSAPINALNGATVNAPVSIPDASALTGLLNGTLGTVTSNL